jgi:hypothetical protein
MITLKMYGKRTQNAECVNSQNKLGFHLSDGAIYTYTTGTAATISQENFFIYF